MTRTKALVVLVLFVMASAGYADVRVFTLGDEVARTATRALDLARTAKAQHLSQLHLVAAAECYRVNYLRWQVDRSSYSRWQEERTTVQFLNAAGPHRRALLVLSRAFKATATGEHLLPLTDCAAAVDRPYTYRPPPAIPFSIAPQALLHSTLSHPPLPPRR